MYYCGIDPGLSGAIAFYDPDTDDLKVFDMPTHEITVNRKKKRRLDLYQLGLLFEVWHTKVAHALVEEVSALPGQGVTSMFNFGFAAGAAQTIVAANMIPMDTVPPARWKRAMGLTSDKDASRRLASRIMPKFTHLWLRVKDDGRAEAALLAYYGWKTKP